tara:strand:- start:170 stop:271 length:102 start_codon:yes stop_codon:yes gene_type:complete
MEMLIKRSDLKFGEKKIRSFLKMVENNSLKIFD